MNLSKVWLVYVLLNKVRDLKVVFFVKICLLINGLIELKLIEFISLFSLIILIGTEWLGIRNMWLIKNVNLSILLLILV